MEAEAKYTYIGAAALVLVLALVSAVVWFKRVGAEQDQRRYTIYFERQRLEGLQVGGDVDLRGVKVGRVEGFALADYTVAGDLVNRVRVTVRIDRNAPIRTNTVAVITRNFVTGIAQITLVTPEPAGPPLPEPAGEQLAVINEGRSDLDELAGRVGLLGDMTAEALGNLNRVLNAENRAALAGTLANLRELTAGLNQRLERFDRTLEQVGDAAERIGAGTQRLAETAERAGAGVDALVADTRRAVMQAEHAAAEVARAVAALQAQAQAITDRVDQTAASWDDQLSAAVAELRLSVDVAARAFDRLQDPRGAVLGPDKAQLGPGEKLR